MKYIYLIIMLFISNCLLAQFGEIINTPKSPEVYSFEKYGNIINNQYNGRPNITIPIYTVSHGDIEIPLNLVYNSNGIRVDEEASEFGLGWYFHNGIITQTINGKNDLDQDVFVDQPDYYTGNSLNYIIDPTALTVITRTPTTPNNNLDDFFISKIRTAVEDLSPLTPSPPFVIIGQIIYPKNNQIKDYLNITESPKYEDFEIDYFHANFFGHNISFFLNPRLSVNGPYIFTVINNEKYKVELIAGNWKITTPNGFIYNFNEKKSTYSGSSAFESGVNLDIQTTDYYTTTNFLNIINTINSSFWKITSIKDTKQNEVFFNYENLSDIYYNQTNQVNYNIYNILSTLIYGDVNQNSSNGSYTNFYGPLIPFVTEHTYQNLNSGYHTKHNTKRYTSTSKHQRSILKEIIFSNKKVLFNNSPRVDLVGDRKVDNIEVFYKNLITKKISFTYDYFNNQSTDNSQKRLKLVNFKLNENENLYKFSYNPIELPNKNSLSFDYWGYYNGMPNTSIINNPFRMFENQNDIPNWAKPFKALLNEKCNRSAHPIFSKAGILEKIEYPTGGHTEIEYELNVFDNIYFPNYDNKIGIDNDNNFTTEYSQLNSKGYGLRVKKTIDYINQNNFYIKKFNYFDGKHIPHYTGYYNELFSNQEINYSSFNLNSQTFDVFNANGYVIQSNNTLLFQSNFLGNGDQIGYSSVEVEQIDSNQINNGKTKYFYSNIPDISPKDKLDNGYGGSYGFRSSYFDLLGSSIRNNDIDNGLLLREEFYNKNLSIIKTIDYSYSSILYPNQTKFNLKLIPYQKYYTYRSEPIYNINTANIVAHEFNEYLLFYFPLKKTNTKLSSQKTTEYFPSGIKWTQTVYQYNSNNIPTGKKIRDQFGNYFYEESSSIATSPDLIARNILNFPATTEIYENGTTRKYYNHIYNTINNNILPSKVEELPEGNPDPAKKITFFYDQYDNKNNLLQYHKENDIYTSIIWGYNKTLPVAKIENAQYNTIQPSLITAIQNASDTGTETQLLDALNNLRSSLPNAMVTTFTHKPLVGILSVTDVKGNKSTYYYDTNNRLQYVKDKDGNIVSENEYHFRPQN